VCINSCISNGSTDINQTNPRPTTNDSFNKPDLRTESTDSALRTSISSSADRSTDINQTNPRLNNESGLFIRPVVITDVTDSSPVCISSCISNGSTTDINQTTRPQASDPFSINQTNPRLNNESGLFSSNDSSNQTNSRPTTNDPFSRNAGSTGIADAEISISSSGGSCSNISRNSDISTDINQVQLVPNESDSFSISDDKGSNQTHSSNTLGGSISSSADRRTDINQTNPRPQASDPFRISDDKDFNNQANTRPQASDPFSINQTTRSQASDPFSINQTPRPQVIDPFNSNQTPCLNNEPKPFSTPVISAGSFSRTGSSSAESSDSALRTSISSSADISSGSGCTVVALAMEVLI
jgi:hypothetical protein